MKPAKNRPASKTPIPPKERAEQTRARARRISGKLRKIYGKKGTALKFDDPFQLIVATALSAQCTDDMVNKTTPALFAKYPDAKSMAAAPQDDIERLIHSTGFFRQKAKNAIALSKAVIERFGGKIPEAMEDLTTLPGVGRKTANLVRAMAYGHPGIIVDTHFRRLAQRMGLADTDDPTKIEHRIAELLPPAHWTEFSNSLIWHGRALCPARKPNCAECPVLADCPTGQESIKHS